MPPTTPRWRVLRTTNLPLRDLTPDPRSISIYGDDEDIDELADSINRLGLLSPLIVAFQPATLANLIISGNRRFRAIQQLGWTEAPVEVRQFDDWITEYEILLAENTYRSAKTNIQRYRERDAHIVIKEARIAQAAAERQAAEAEAARVAAETTEDDEEQFGAEIGTELAKAPRTGPVGNDDAHNQAVEEVAAEEGVSARTIARSHAVTKKIDAYRAAGEVDLAAMLERIANQESATATDELVQHRLCAEALRILLAGKATKSARAIDLAVAEWQAAQPPDPAVLEKTRQQEYNARRHAFLAELKKAENITQYTAEQMQEFARDPLAVPDVLIAIDYFERWLPVLRAVFTESAPPKLVALKGGRAHATNAHP
jgi:ParB-like chromosome segregation protein Spo0J